MNPRVLGLIQVSSAGVSAGITGVAIAVVATLDYATGIQLRV
jgi:hypothetical protein